MQFFPYLIILFSTFFYYLPILLNPKILLARGNDLEEVFWPIFYFIKQQIVQTNTIPFWNNMFLSGTPLLPDPQFSLSYPLNIIFILFSIDQSFIIYVMLHSFIGSVGIYLICKSFFKYDDKLNVFAALLYLFTPKTAGFLEAGHVGLVATTAWIPYVLLAILMMHKKVSLLWSILFSISLAGLFFTHTIIFILTAVASVLTFLCCLLIYKSNYRSLVYLIAGFILTLGLISVTLLPQLEWMPQTTRFLLIQDKDVYPKWESIFEFTKMLFWSWSANDIHDSEKWLTLGILPVILAIFGFWKVSIKLKITIFFTLTISFLISLNNILPYYNYLLNQQLFVLMRITTRIWFIPIIIITILATYGLKFLLLDKQYQKLSYLIALITLTELLFLSWYRINLPIVRSEKLSSDSIYNSISSDKELYRIYCTTRCISQKDAAIQNLQLVDGYNTLQQHNFYKQAWQLTGGYWNYYTLSIPPIGLYTFDKLEPDDEALGKFNTKYIISPYSLQNPNLKLVQYSNNYYIYINESFLPRAYFQKSVPEQVLEAPILKYSPNYIKVATTSYSRKSLILSEVYNSNWKAYLNGTEEVGIQETPDALRLVDINTDTKFVEFKYEPTSYNLGKWISFTTLIIIIFVLSYYFKRKSKKD